MTFIAGRLVVSECNLIKAGLQPDATNVITKALVIFIESASIYTGWAVFYCVSYETQSDARFVARDCSPAVAGLTFGLIIVQARLAFPQGVAERRTGNTTDELRFASQHTSHMLTSIVVNVPDIAREPEDMDADNQHDSLPQVKLLKLDPLHGMQHGS
ncbi:uncharacterized protein B0H18DRAFT_451583 [Fomitopsis serialis]|uniref:uncharacterized protein n=1 Tax=Fomitopsis serialis TaxID=139415 RepID=UPI002007384B|nr:uncharacterized protein B0H18DRAFT_451583 [Neoantrodia serialis]KAH9923886.1 hypothetical protein B0H18DRAFT_451583 [Neoantrodia serialis]